MSKMLPVYKHLHQNPELSGEEYETTKYLIELLKKYPLEIIKLEKTGVIAKTKTDYLETIVYRADIDALPIVEQTTSQYQSKNKGVMHACGHDIHTASLLQFIDVLFAKDQKFSHNLVFVFQPSEEKDGGAQQVIMNETFSKLKIKAIYAVHVWPQLELGKITSKEGTLMGTNRVFKIKLNGKGSHASTPHLGHSVLEPMMEVITYLNYLIAKENDPFNPLVINVGQIKGGKAVNIIMDQIEIAVTMRAIDDEIINSKFTQIKNYVNNLKSSYEIYGTIKEVEKSYPTVENAHKLYKLNEQLITTRLNEAYLTVEDFGFYKYVGPTLMFLIGTDCGENESLHSATFLPNVTVIEIISELYQKVLENHEKN